MNEVIFSHRPIFGVSVAAVSNGSQLFFSYSLVNNGVSSNERFNAERRDSFSRTIARNILRGRLSALVEGTGTQGIVFDTNISAREFMAEFRKTFKPDQDEVEGLFETTFGDRMNANQIVKTIYELANDVIAEKTESVS